MRDYTSSKILLPSFVVSPTEMRRSDIYAGMEGRFIEDLMRIMMRFCARHRRFLMQERRRNEEMSLIRIMCCDINTMSKFEVFIISRCIYTYRPQHWPLIKWSLWNSMLKDNGNWPQPRSYLLDYIDTSVYSAQIAIQSDSMTELFGNLIK